MSQSRLRVIDPNVEHARDTAKRLVKKYRKLRAEDLSELRNATVREGSGMKWLPVWFRYWWKQPIIMLPKGETEKRLGYKR